MAKELKQYLDIDVYTAAKKRINHIIDIFDTVMVCFSGGKDSLAVLNLVEEVYRERGINEKIKVIFRDEELIPDNVIDFVQEKYRSGKYDFRYYAIPLKSNKYVLGNMVEYVQWDPNREWVRQPPAFAIRLPEGDKRVFDQYTADAFITKDEKGSVALINGIRTQESLFRFRSVVNKKNECYISATEEPTVKMCKPIYDWSEQDVFLYFYKNKIKYCEIYDEETYNGELLRVSTPLHSEAAKKFDKLKTRSPKLYQQIVKIFPDMVLQERYYNDMRNGTVDFSKYPHNFDGLRQFIRDTVPDPVMQAKAMKVVHFAEGLRAKRNPTIANKFCGYPILYCFEVIAKGQYKRSIALPIGRLADKYIKFEMEGEK